MKMRIKQNMRETDLDRISTETIYPISINQQQATFIIQDRGGSIDKHASVVLPVKSSTDGDFLPFTPQEWKERVQVARHGNKEIYEPSDIGSCTNTAVAQPNIAGKINLKNINWTRDDGVQLQQQNGVDNGGNVVFGASAFYNYKDYAVRNNNDFTARLYVSLQDLFPRVFSALELDLTLIQGQISLVLQFTENGENMHTNRRICQVHENLVVNAPLGCEIITSEVVMLIDYLVKKDNTSAREEVRSEAGKSYVYGDLVWNNHLLKGLPTASANLDKNLKRDIIQIGLSNNVVRQLFLINSPTTKTVATGAGPRELNYAQQNPLKNVYCSRALTGVKDGLSVQLRINNMNLYNTPLDTQGQHISELETAFGVPLNVPISTYSYLDSSVDELDKLVYPTASIGDTYPIKSLIPVSSHVQGWQTTALLGSNNYLGFNLQKNILTPSGALVRADDVINAGRRINNTPLEIHIDRMVRRYVNYNDKPDPATSTDDRNLLICSVVEKVLNIKNGVVRLIDA
jgi:hypothetical protein